MCHFLHLCHFFHSCNCQNNVSIQVPVGEKFHINIQYQGAPKPQVYWKFKEGLAIAGEADERAERDLEPTGKLIILPFTASAHVQHYDKLNKIEFDIYRNNKHIGKHIFLLGWSIFFTL